MRHDHKRQAVRRRADVTREAADPTVSVPAGWRWSPHPNPPLVEGRGKRRAITWGVLYPLGVIQLPHLAEGRGKRRAIAQGALYPLGAIQLPPLIEGRVGVG
jgi:hypothetical protein